MIIEISASSNVHDLLLSMKIFYEYMSTILLGFAYSCVHYFIMSRLSAVIFAERYSFCSYNCSMAMYDSCSVFHIL